MTRHLSLPLYEMTWEGHGSLATVGGREGVDGGRGGEREGERGREGERET